MAANRLYFWQVAPPPASKKYYITALKEIDIFFYEYNFFKKTYYLLLFVTRCKSETWRLISSLPHRPHAGNVRNEFMLSVINH